MIERRRKKRDESEEKKNGGRWVYKEIKAGLIGVIKLNKWVPYCFVISGFTGFQLGSFGR